TVVRLPERSTETRYGVSGKTRQHYGLRVDRDGVAHLPAGCITDAKAAAKSPGAQGDGSCDRGVRRLGRAIDGKVAAGVDDQAVLPIHRSVRQRQVRGRSLRDGTGAGAHIQRTSAGHRDIPAHDLELIVSRSVVLEGPVDGRGG